MFIIAETILQLQETSYGWKTALDCQRLKMNLVKIKVILSIMWQYTVTPSCMKDPCVICGRNTMVIVVLCKCCGNWLHGRCARI